MTTRNARVVIIPETRLSYPHLFEPHAPVEGADPKYSATLLIPKSDDQTVAALKTAAKTAITERWSRKMVLTI